MSGALDAISLDITGFRVGNHCCCESVQSRVAWAAVSPPLFGNCCVACLRVVSWLLSGGWGGGVGCTGCAGELRTRHRSPAVAQTSPSCGACNLTDGQPLNARGGHQGWWRQLDPYPVGLSLTDVWWLTPIWPYCPAGTTIASTAGCGFTSYSYEEQSPCLSTGDSG